MKILVTGASGFIGDYVIQQLLGIEKVQIIATATSNQKIKTKNWFSKVRFIPYDIHNSEHTNLVEYFDNPHKMIHLAWKGLPNYMNPFHINENLPADFRFIENLVINGLRDITITGTCFEYGMQEGCLSEDMPCSPNNYYALAKNTLRIMLEILQKSYPFELKWIRLFYMYGKGQNPNSIIAQLEKAIQNNDTVFNMSGGEQIRDYIPIETVANNIIKIAMQSNIVGIINNCSGSPIKIKDFIEEYISSHRYKIKLNLGYYPYSTIEPMEFWGDNGKISSI